MKRFKTVLDDMPRTAMQKEPTTGTPIGGLAKENGMLITRPLKHHPKTAFEQSTTVHKNGSEENKAPALKIPHSHIIQAREAAKSLKILLERKRPTKEYDEFTKARLVYPECTSREDATIKKASQPCGAALSISLFSGYLRIHKTKKETDKDTLDMIRDHFVAVMEGFPEYAVTLALVELVLDEENPFFPQLATLKKLMEKHTVFQPEIHDWEKGFRSKEEIAEMWDARKALDVDALVRKIRDEGRKKRGEQYNSEV